MMSRSSRNKIIRAMENEVNSGKFSAQANGVFAEGMELLQQYEKYIEQITVGTAIAALVWKEDPFVCKSYPLTYSELLKACNMTSSSVYDDTDGKKQLILKCGELALKKTIPFYEPNLKNIVSAYPSLGVELSLIANTSEDSLTLQYLKKYSKKNILPTIFWPSVMSGVSALGLFTSHSLAESGAAVSWGLFAKMCAVIPVWGWALLVTVSAGWLVRNIYKRCKEDTESIPIAYHLNP
jgi:hypothetical protein